jgi:hypothetical protein
VFPYFQILGKYTLENVFESILFPHLMFRNYITLMMEVIRTSETSSLKRAKWRHIPEHGILHSGRRENLKSLNHSLNVL